MPAVDLESVHAALVHFPITFLISAALVLLIRPKWGKAVEFPLIVAGAVMGLASVLSGLANATVLGTGEEVSLHRTLGLATLAVAMLATAAFRRSRRLAVALTLLAGFLVAATGYFGGELAHPPRRSQSADQQRPPDDRVPAQVAIDARHEEPSVRLKTVGALANLHGPAPRALLETLKDDTNPDIAIAAAAALRDYEIDFGERIVPLFESECFECHGPNRARGGLQLLAREAVLAGGKHGPAVDLKDPDRSLILARLRSTNEDERMPPKHALSAEQIALIKTWVSQGAYTHSVDDSEKRFRRVDAQHLVDAAKHWAYAPPIQPEVPSYEAWGHNPIDGFVLAELQTDGHGPRVEASPAILLRRVYLDLIGRVPSPDEAEAFLKAPSRKAYEQIVDELLATEEYAMARVPRWLDLARYADSYGTGKDRSRAIFAYRDWVTTAIARDLPYDEFVRQQLAGDLLPEATDTQKVATGFLRSGGFSLEGGTDPNEVHHRVLVDQVNTVSTAFLGLTMRCAECHDHKHDALSQRDFYRILAVLNDGENETAAVGLDMRDVSPQLVLTPVKLEHASIAIQKRDALASKCTDGPCRTELEKAQAEVLARSREVVVTPVCESTGARPTTIAIRGDFRAAGARVAPGIPAIFENTPLPEPLNRLSFANWLTSTNNPLFARVTVNRFWEQHFGRGIIDSVDDFGVHGGVPSHPALLDWLAVEFASNGYSRKALDRLLVTSATYRQSSDLRAAPATARPTVDNDDENARLGRGPRVRLDAEVIRDNLLLVGGVLEDVRGGRPSDSDDVNPAPRRTIYERLMRTAPSPMLQNFDLPERQESIGYRSRSSSALQALTLVNAPEFVAAAVALSERARAQATVDEKRIDFLFRSLFVRHATPEEVIAVLAFLREQRRGGVDDGHIWFLVTQALFGLDETVVRL